MEQKTGIGSFYDEFLRGYGAEISLFVLEFLSNSTYKPTTCRRGEIHLLEQSGDTNPGADVHGP